MSDDIRSSPGSPDDDVEPVDVDRPFTRAGFRASGLNPGTLHEPEYTRVMPWVWVRKVAIDRFTLIRAALLIHPASAYASFVSAAIVLGLPVPDPPFVHVTVTKAKDRRFRAQIKPHVTDRIQRVIERNGIRTTDPIETFIDCAGLLGLVDMVVLGDALVKQYGIGPSALVRACAGSTDYYAKLALNAASFVREGVDSPMETRLRMLIVLAGLPKPVVNFRIHHDDGTWRRRFDLCYPSLKLIIEYDGLHHAQPQNRENDIERREEFDDEGYRIIVVTARGVYRTPEKTLHRIRRQLVLRGASDVPEIDDRWRDFFAA
ncbi:endonuclease domain-containing protein [Nocardioides plantarum]|uniref:Endonuclease domain-containing protein n=1 Tax=Nocardioides plantarum TaxID=29299 RepID=A0ABV5K6K3_9ACTN|nr:DUF559 domain-containing protein [Nocardioides plantarum]